MLAAGVAGSETRFVAAMNAEARALGMDTRLYTDPSGFDPEHGLHRRRPAARLPRAMRFPASARSSRWPSVTLPVAGTLTNFNPLIADGYAGKTGSDSAAGGLPGVLHPRDGRRARADRGRRGAGQGQGSDTSVILAAAGEAATQLVESASPRRSACARSPRPARAAQEETLADTALRCCSLPVAPRRRTDVNALTTHRRTHD